MGAAIIVVEWSGSAAVVKCGSCKGSGKSRHHNYCQACNGAGHVTIVCEESGIPILKCGSCDGTGESRHHNYCQACGGTGAAPAYGKFTIRKAQRSN